MKAPVRKEVSSRLRNGKLYGTTSSGGAGTSGVLFEYDINTDTYAKKVDFTGSNGANPYGDIVQATDGKLHGMTNGGGANSMVLFTSMIHMPRPAITQLSSGFLMVRRAVQHPMVHSWNHRLANYMALPPAEVLSPVVPSFNMILLELSLKIKDWVVLMVPLHCTDHCCSIHPSKFRRLRSGL